MPELGSLPAPRFGGTKNRLNHRHIADRVLDGNRNVPIATNGARKYVSLNSVLIASFEALCAHTTAEHITAVIDKYSARPVVRCVEGYFDFYPALCAEELHSLVRNELRAACEDTLA